MGLIVYRIRIARKLGVYIWPGGVILDLSPTEAKGKLTMRNLFEEAANRPKISAAFVKAQRDFSPAIKNSVNPHFKKKYADLAACVNAVIDALNDNGIALIQRNHYCDGGVIVETVFLHESGESISAGQLHVAADRANAQGYGSALTYARRFALMSACGIAPEDDDGNAASESVNAEQAANIKALADKVGKPVAEICRYFNVKKLEQLPAAKYHGIINTLEKKREEAK